MLEFLGYVTLFLSIAAAILVVVYFHSYLYAFLAFWLLVTIAAMLILHFKKS